MKSRPKKLSYKEQRELESLPDQIAALEKEQLDIRASLADGLLQSPEGRTLTEAEVARAVADEPTGDLDRASAEDVLNLIDRLNRERRRIEADMLEDAEAILAGLPTETDRATLTLFEPGWHAGVVGLIAPAEAQLLGLVSLIAPAVVSGNTVVALASEQNPYPAIVLGELLATGSQSETILYADVEPATVAAVRDRFRFLRDRR